MDVGDVSPEPPDPEVSIEERLRTVCGHLNVLNAQLVELAAEAVDTGAWEGWGVRSLEHWLSWQAGISPARAREVVRLAGACETHPQVMATFADGGLSVDQAAIATKAPGYLDDWFATVATFATVAQLRTMVRGASTPMVEPTPADKPPVETLSGWFDDDGRYHLRGELDADLHRRPRPGHRPRQPPDQTHRATPRTDQTLRTPHRRTTATLVDHLPRPTTLDTGRRRRLTRARASTGQLGGGHAVLDPEQHAVFAADRRSHDSQPRGSAIASGARALALVTGFVARPTNPVTKARSVH